MFGLIGSLVDISIIEPNLLLQCLVLVIVALSVRSIGVYLSMIRTDLDYNEIAFLAAAWIPKSTVQAVLISEIYERAIEFNMPVEEKWGLQVITICIFFILFTAPIGAVLISVLGPMLLPYGDISEVHPFPVAVSDVRPFPVARSADENAITV